MLPLLPQREGPAPKAWEGLSPHPDLTDRLTSTYRSLQRHLQQLLSLNSKLHRKLRKHLTGISVDDESDGLLRTYTPLIAVEELIFADLGSRSLMLDHSRLVGILYVRECMRSALVAYQKAVAL